MRRVGREAYGREKMVSVRVCVRHVFLEEASTPHGGDPVAEVRSGRNSFCSAFFIIFEFCMCLIVTLKKNPQNIN